MHVDPVTDVWTDTDASLTVEYVHDDGGLRVPHAARVVARVPLGGARDVQPAHRAVLQQVRLDAAKEVESLKCPARARGGPSINASDAMLN